MQPLHNSYRWQMKAMRVVPTKTYQHPYAKHCMHTPCIQLGTCIFQPCTQHSMQTSHISQWSYTLTCQTSVHCHLSFSNDSNPMDTSTSSSNTSPESLDIEDEDFQTVPMDNEHWTTELVHQKKHFAYTKMGYPTMFAHTHAHMDPITLYHI